MPLCWLPQTKRRLAQVVPGARIEPSGAQLRSVSNLEHLTFDLGSGAVPFNEFSCPRILCCGGSSGYGLPDSLPRLAEGGSAAAVTSGQVRATTTGYRRADKSPFDPREWATSGLRRWPG